MNRSCNTEIGLQTKNLFQVNKKAVVCFKRFKIFFFSLSSSHSVSLPNMSAAPLPPPLLLPPRTSLAQGDGSSAPVVCYCPHGNPPPPLQICLPPTEISEACTCGLAHISFAIQSLAQGFPSLPQILVFGEHPLGLH